MDGDGPTYPNEDLRRLLTPELFSLIFNARLPYDRHASTDFAEFGRDIFLEGHFGPAVRKRAGPALTALGKTGLDRAPDLSTFLPAPADPAYPEQCVGLQLVLDTCPRVLMRAADARWTHAYFAPLSERLDRIWRALPGGQRPDAWERGLGRRATLDYWIALRFWFRGPLVHSERAADQRVALAYADETRAVVEAETGLADPWRATRAKVLADVTGFARVYRAGPPCGGDVTAAAWAFWAAMLMDMHAPIIERFGRYPYLNAVTGRVSTEEERQWIEETAHFGEASEDVAKKVIDDVKAGRWTPLGTDSLA